MHSYLDYVTMLYSGVKKYKKDCIEFLTTPIADGKVFFFFFLEQKERKIVIRTSYFKNLSLIFLTHVSSTGFEEVEAVRVISKDIIF